MTDSHWGEMVRAMDKLNMNIIVIQEVFRNEEYAGKHSVNVTNYILVKPFILQICIRDGWISRLMILLRLY